MVGSSIHTTHSYDTHTPPIRITILLHKDGGQGLLEHPQSGELHRPLTPILLKSIGIHLPFLSRYFGKNMPPSWQKVVYTPPICIAIRLPFLSQDFCGSIRVRGRGNTPIGPSKEVVSKRVWSASRDCAHDRVAPVRFGSVTVWGWNGSSGSGFRFRRFL